jgi:hypothetical protein
MKLPDYADGSYQVFFPLPPLCYGKALSLAQCLSSRSDMCILKTYLYRMKGDLSIPPSCKEHISIERPTWNGSCVSASSFLQI